MGIGTAFVKQQIGPDVSAKAKLSALMEEHSSTVTTVAHALWMSMDYVANTMLVCYVTIFFCCFQILVIRMCAGAVSHN